MLVMELFEPLTTNFRNYCLGSRKGPKEMRTIIISRFFANWRQNVGPNLEPAMRLILPNLDRDRAMYGLKEKTLGVLIVRMLQIGKESPDGKAILNYKSESSSSIGHFSQVCADVIKKRNVNVKFSSMTIDQVNDVLDELADASKQDDQLRVFRKFYDVMNSEEMMWIIRICLRYMNLGATAKTIFDNFHPDAMGLFSVTSSLSKVCAELYDPESRLSSDQNQVTVMSCFQPQLCLFKKLDFQNIVNIMPKSGFYMEEKMDGERIQIHMTDSGKKIRFFSRNAKDYTYLYGSSYDDEKGSLTKHLAEIISPKVKNIILDGEMVAWDDDEKVIVPFGSLKTAAISEQEGSRNLFPLFVAFDILVVNDKQLTEYSLSDRKKVLASVITEKPGHFKVIPYTVGKTADDLSVLFDKVLQSASEGLVIKNPETRYTVGERNPSWIKLKPDYFDTFGENLDVCIVGGYYGNGARGGILASFLVGVRAEDDPEHPEKFYTLCRVGGGFSAQDLRRIRHLTENKWMKWPAKNPPTDYVVTEPGGDKPEVWIRPSDSLVVELKGTEIVDSTTYSVGKTIRFPRFQRMRDEEKDWKSALSLDEFRFLVEEEKRPQKGKRKLEISERSPRKKRTKMPILGDDNITEVSPKSQLFHNYVFYVAADVRRPQSMSKQGLESLIKANGGEITQDPMSSSDILIIADRAVLTVKSLIKSKERPIFTPKWIFDCIKSQRILQIEPAYFFSGPSDLKAKAQSNADHFGDSWERQIDVDELKDILSHMDVSNQYISESELTTLRNEFLNEQPYMKDVLFLGIHVSMSETDPDNRLWLAANRLRYGAAKVTYDSAAHADFMIIDPKYKTEIPKRPSAPILSAAWVEDAWAGRLSREDILKPPEKYLLSV